MFAPEGQDTYFDDFSITFSFDLDDADISDDWDSGAFFYMPYNELIVEKLDETLAMGLDAGSTAGDIIVAEFVEGHAVLPIAGGSTANTAAIVVGYLGHPEVKKTLCDIDVDICARGLVF